MLEGLKRLLELEPCSLIIVKKSLIPIIQKMLPPGAKCIHFFGNRGSNEFMGFKQVIIFGAPGFDKETVLMYASCLYYDRNLSTDTGLVKRTYTGTDKAVNIFSFLEPLVQNILEVSREDEAYQSCNRGRLMLYPDIRLVLLTNIVLEQIPVTRLISLDDLIGKTDDPRSDAHRAVIRELVERQLDTIGFISVSRTLSPFLESGHGPPKAVARYFSDKQAVIPVPVARRMVKRTIERHAKDIADDMRLAPFRLLFKTLRCNGFIEIRGRDASCVERAAAFFRACPGYENHMFSMPGRKDGSEKC